MRVIVPAIVAAIAVSSCSGSGNPSPPPPSGSDNSTPISPGQRLAWSQAAPTQDAAQGYRFVLFVDDLRTPLSGASCGQTPGSPDYECTASLPKFQPGRHVLELSAMDPNTGRESARSAQFVVNQAASSGLDDGATTILRRSAISPRASEVPRDQASAPVSVGHDALSVERKSVVCASGRPATCFSVSLIAKDLTAVQRIVALPDGRLLVLYARGIVQILPSGERERLQMDRSAAPSDVADIAVDPDFPTTRFVYFATVASAANGRSAVNVVRMRELSDRLGEAATLAVELPASAEGRPAISIGPDRRIYVALPSADRRGSIGGPYDGLVLRLTREGTAAGHERTGSPVLAIGSARPAALAWIDASRLLLASGGVGDAALGFVSLAESNEAWPPPVISLPTFEGDHLMGAVKQVAFQSARPHASTESALFVLGVDPDVLYFARLATGNQPEMLSIDPVALGPLRPTAVAVDTNGDAIVAARIEGPDQPDSLFRLHAQ